ncbi:MAG TPA: hypothetical protein VIE43_22820 [Thermoanaerobaculia bacterium]|jgi:hypothetical protein|nr:hypothetical protein [Thermoanaerobaculia bacterium]
MNAPRWSAVLLSAALFVPLPGRAEDGKTEIKGAAILDHPCGKVAVKQMGLIHDGKTEEAFRLGTPEMQAKWKALPDKDRAMMLEMMKAMSKTEAQLADEIKAGGLLVVDGRSATLTVKHEQKDANGSSSDTLTQSYVLDGATCLISR